MSSIPGHDISHREISRVGSNPGSASPESPGPHHKSARNTSNAKAVQHKKGSGENLQSQLFASKRWRQKHACKTSKVLQSDCKVYRICPSWQPRSCHLTADDITFVGAEPVDVLCIWRLSESNFAPQAGVAGCRSR